MMREVVLLAGLQLGACAWPMSDAVADLCPVLVELNGRIRNTSLFLLRHNLARDADNQPRDGRYIFVSGRRSLTRPHFHESISTLDGHPHDHILYSWNSRYCWLRREIRHRLGQTGGPMGSDLRF